MWHILASADADWPAAPRGGIASLTAMTRHTWFYRGMALLAAALAIAGFSPGLLVPAYPRQPLTPLVATHAVLCAGWLA